MRTKRLLAAAAAATVAAIAPLSAPIAAAAEGDGVGTGTVNATVLQIDLGEGGQVLSVRVVGDDGNSTIDPSNGAPVATTTLNPLTIASGVVPALNLQAPPVTSTSTGAEDTQEVAPALPDQPAFSGSMVARLTSIVDAAGARSGLDSSLTDLSIAGGLLSVPGAIIASGTDAALGKAAATRSISIPSIEVLNLAALLEGAGLALEALPLDALLGLLAGLGIVLPEIPDPGEVIGTVNAAIDALQDATGELTTEICATIDGVLAGLGGLAGVGAIGGVAGGISDAIDTVGGDGGTPGLPELPGVPSLLGAQALPVTCDQVTGTVQDLIDDLQAVVASVLTAVLDVLGQTALLTVEGVEVGVVAHATSAVESSVAEVTGTIGSVKVGALEVPGVSGLDLTAAVEVLHAAGDAVTGAVGSVLVLINAELANMVDVDVLTIEEVVGANGAYTNARAAVTALTARITPPALLTGALDLTGSATDILGEANAAVPVLAPGMGALEAALGGVDALTGTSTITVGQLSSSSAFTPVAASVVTDPAAPPAGELPRTGTDAAVPAIAAVLVAGVALGIRRLVSVVAAN